MGKRIRIGLATGAAAMLAVLPAAPAPALAAEADCNMYYPPGVYEVEDCAEYVYTSATGARCELGGGYIGDEIMWCFYYLWEELRG